MIEEFVSRVGDVIVLENEQRYLVLDCIYFNEKYYLNVAVIDPKFDDDVDKYVSFKYVEEIIKGEKLTYAEVEDKTIQKSLFELQQKYKDK